jgi:WD40 repeat protein
MDDFSIRMWCARSGVLLRTLRGHDARCPVVECHPQDPRLLLSAGYDGRLLLWDLDTGALLSR